MLILVIGGAASGKSAFAEKTAKKLLEDRGKKGTLIYAAAMKPEGEEALFRINRHRKMREGKGFETVEIYREPVKTLRAFLEKRGLSEKKRVVLLECLPNLLSDLFFSEKGEMADVKETEEIFYRTVKEIEELSGDLILTGGDLFSDGVLYSKEVEAYRRILALVQSRLASGAELVVETVCGIPVYLKGK